jgi:hypothetical protein
MTFFLFPYFAVVQVFPCPRAQPPSVHPLCVTTSEIKTNFFFFCVSKWHLTPPTPPTAQHPPTPRGRSRIPTSSSPIDVIRWAPNSTLWQGLSMHEVQPFGFNVQWLVLEVVAGFLFFFVFCFFFVFFDVSSRTPVQGGVISVRIRCSW